MRARDSHGPRAHDPWILLGIVGSIALAWSGVLDGISAEYIDKALLGSGAVYATARGINALVSVLQGTEMNALVFTFTVGELLDPLNDLIERFSDVMLWALGSLALQKILIEIVSDTTFNILLTVFGAGLVALKYIGPPGFLRIIAKFFGVTIILRFSFAAVILANGWVDSVFLENDLNKRHLAMQGFREELNVVIARVGIESDLAGEMKDVATRIDSNQRAQEEERKQQYLNGVRLEETEAKRDAADKRSLWEKMRGHRTKELDKLDKEIQDLKFQIKSSDYTLSALAESREALDEKLECLNKRSRGESCSLFESASRAVQALNVRKQIDDLVMQLDDFASNLIALLMSLMLKSVILPLLFLYILLKSVRHVFTN